MHVVAPRRFHPRKTLFVGSVILVLIVVALNRKPPSVPMVDVHWVGSTMGTRYDIKIVEPSLEEAEKTQLRASVEAYLQEVNNQMSTYIAGSEISRFNQFTQTEPFPVSDAFARVTGAALSWATKTGGAFDPTLDPLITLWGFGTRALSGEWPTASEIEAAREKTGYADVVVLDAGHLQKADGDRQLNLNAIAKGYGVDGVYQLLIDRGLTNIYVEIGGDLRVSGVNALGVPWRIAVEWPDPEAGPGERTHGIAHLAGGALAGSGDYRSFHRDESGRILSHIFDPRTGYPVQHQLAAVNVWAPTCMDADAAATALMVMGAEAGGEWIESVSGIEAAFFTREESGDFTVHYSSGYRQQTAYQVIPNAEP
jgi:FAD:protein FMN transferase